MRHPVATSGSGISDARCKIFVSGHTLLILRPRSRRLRRGDGLLLRLGLEVGLDLPAVSVARALEDRFSDQ